MQGRRQQKTNSTCASSSFNLSSTGQAHTPGGGLACNCFSSCACRDAQPRGDMLSTHCQHPSATPSNAGTRKKARRFTEAALVRRTIRERITAMLDGGRSGRVAVRVGVFVRAGQVHGVVRRSGQRGSSLGVSQSQRSKCTAGGASAATTQISSGYTPPALRGSSICC